MLAARSPMADPLPNAMTLCVTTRRGEAANLTMEPVIGSASSAETPGREPAKRDSLPHTEVPHGAHLNACGVSMGKLAAGWAAMLRLDAHNSGDTLDAFREHDDRGNSRGRASRSRFSLRAA